ncbi:unnamed protein product [Trichogramma brassicae]|uniref:Uncharacterized protein n=1 Tax=Trichogramma brassicae TaxID=86971 RepID=A0A6H5J293_9HYME|nr:unnamed protein product [Trichogramma brassicae]
MRLFFVSFARYGLLVNQFVVVHGRVTSNIFFYFHLSLGFRSQRKQLLFRDPPGLTVSREEVRTSHRVGPAAGEPVTLFWAFGYENGPSRA